jgi:hypothetical protein
MHAVPGGDCLLALDAPPQGSFAFLEMRDGFLVGARSFHLLTGRLVSVWAAEGWRWRWAGDKPYALTRDVSQAWTAIVDTELTDTEKLARGLEDPWGRRGLSAEGGW